MTDGTSDGQTLGHYGQRDPPSGEQMPTATHLRTALAAVSALFACLILVQLFLAGLAVFAEAGSFSSHRNFGYIIGWLTLVIVVLAAAGRVGGRLLGLALLALVQMGLQSVLVLLRADLPVVAVLHPVNGVILLLVSIAIARGAWQMRAAATSTSRGEGDGRVPA